LGHPARHSSRGESYSRRCDLGRNGARKTTSIYWIFGWGGGAARMTLDSPPYRRVRGIADSPQFGGGNAQEKLCENVSPPIPHAIGQIWGVSLHQETSGRDCIVTKRGQKGEDRLIRNQNGLLVKRKSLLLGSRTKRRLG